MFKFPIQRSSEDEMLIAIEELKGRGFTQLSDIKCTYKHGKSFNRCGVHKGKEKFRFQGYEDGVKYECMMGKVN